MLRRLILVGLATAMAAPVFAITPASAVILFSCTGATTTATITPGLSHNQTAQTVSATGTVSGCGGGGGSGTFTAGTLSSFPPRPLGCPVSQGGAGPDYADQTPILISGDPGFKISWNDATTSTGIVKTKSNGPANPGKVRVVLVITAGHYAPPSGLKTKSKGILNFTPTDSFNCTNNSDPIQDVNIDNAGNGDFILQQK